MPENDADVNKDTAMKQAMNAEIIARSPAPGCLTPISINYSPDGSRLTFLHSLSSSSRQLCEYHVQNCHPATRPSVLVDLSACAAQKV